MSFNVYFPDDSRYWAHFQVPISHSCIFFLKCLSLLTVFTGFFFFYYWFVGVLYVTWILVFCQMYIFSQSVACLFFVVVVACFFMVKLDEQNYKLLMHCHLFSFMVSPFSFLGNLCHSCEIVLSFLSEIFIALGFYLWYTLNWLFWCEM